MRHLVLALVVLLSGCASQTLNVTPTRSYVVGQQLSAAPGAALLTAETGTIRTVRRWVGILNSADGWETSTAADSSYLKKELIYSGVSGRTIEIGYREFRGGLAAPAFYQSAKYDLNESKIISFQNFQIEVQTADNNGMTGKLLRDGSGSVAQPGAPAVGSFGSSSAAAKGKYTYQAEETAKSKSCAAQPRATLTAAGAGFETYSVPCTNGDTIAIRCEFGNCRVLQ